MREHFEGKCDVADLVHANGIHQEGGLSGAAADLGESLGGVAMIGNVLLFADGLLRNLKDAFQQALMQLDNVERLLALR